MRPPRRWFPPVAAKARRQQLVGDTQKEEGLRYPLVQPAVTARMPL